MDESGERNWETVLRYLYRSERFQLLVSSNPDTLVHETDPIFEACSLKPASIEIAVSRLLAVGLLEEVDGRLSLTQRGFEVAHEQEMERRCATRERKRTLRQSKINRAGVYASIGLLLVGLFRFIAFAYNAIGVTDLGIIGSLLAGTAMVLVIIRAIVREELLFEEIEGLQPDYREFDSHTDFIESPEQTTKKQDSREEADEKRHELEKE